METQTNTDLTSPGPIGGSTPAAGSFTTLTTSSTITMPASTAIGSAANSNLLFSSSNNVTFRYLTTSVAGLAYAGGFMTSVSAAQGFVWGNVATGGSVDTAMARAAANSIQFGGSVTAADATARTELNKSVTAIANAVATDILTVTIPNAAHSATLRVRVTGSLGAGGAIGANEATATNTYMVAITRTAGVATVATATAAVEAVAVAVAGAATVTATAAVTAMTGLVSAQQTFTVQVTISRSGGSSTNHTCLVYAQLMNANATGITIA